MKNNGVMMFLVGITGLIIGGVVVGFYTDGSGTNNTEIKWNILGQELTLNMEKDLTNYSVMLDKLFSEEFAANGAKAWLKSHQHLYHFTDPDLSEKMEFLKYDDLISEQLREISRKRIGPWEYQQDTIEIGIPAEADQPREGSANVCENGDYCNKTIKVMNYLDETKYIIVTATGKYACPRGSRWANIQLNAKDAEKLLGTTNFSKYERGIVLILND
jgi:hypothetical protein